MQPLTPPDSHHLLAAQGWFELGNFTEAHEEIQNITPRLRAHPDVLDIQWHIYAHAHKWEACVDIGNALMTADPNRSSGWIHCSFALHALKRTDEAYVNLAVVADDFPENWTIPYNLACYCARLDRCEEAKEWFKKAIAINDQEVPKKGIDDPDLKPLWDSMSTTVWKKEQ